MRVFFILFLLINLNANLNAGFLSDLFNALTNQNRASEDQSQREDSINREDNEIDQQRDRDIIDKNINLDTTTNTHESVYGDENDLELDDSDINLKENKIYLSYTNYPKRVYINQHFKIRLKVIIIDDNLRSIKVQFLDGKNYKVINKSIEFEKVDQYSYETDIYLKLYNKDATLPKIRVIATNSSSKKYKKDIDKKDINIIQLKDNQLFNGVIADSFTLLSHKEKRYDDKSILVLLETNATNSNLEDFHLPFAKREALDSFEEHLNWQKVYYVCIVPKYQKEFKFKYFNAKSGKFSKISFPIVLADATLSTQLGLDPKKSKFFLYKVIALFTLALILIAIFIRYKSYIALVSGVALIIYVIFTKLITNSISIGKDINIRILPTKNSTIFFKTPKRIDAKVILRKRGYTKVLLPNGKIGWVKDDDLKKD